MRLGGWASVLALGLAWAGSGMAGAAETARFAWFEYRGADPVDARVTVGPGDYRNPILAGFYPDPSVTRVGDDYYLVNSSFAWLPGLPVFHSRDLVNWTQISNAVARPGLVDFGTGGLTGGLFAPSISHHDGLFYIVNTCFYCGGNFVVTARDPAGPWSDPVWLKDLGFGIDPSLFFDDDGRAWIVNNDMPEGGKEQYEGHRALWIQEFDAKTLTSIGPRTMIVDGGVDIRARPVYVEGPHIYKKDGFYYLTAAEGGTGPAHAQMIWRAPTPTGPYLPGPANPILTQRDLDPRRPDPIEAAGHADLVQTQNGDWWALFLGVRPYAGGETFNTGRDTFLLPVTWIDGWPRILEPGKPIPRRHARPALPAQPAAAMPTTGPMAVRDEFDGAALAPYWMTPRMLGGDWHRLGDGALTLTLRPVGLGDRGNPSLWARRQQHMDASAATEVAFQPRRPGDRAGLAVIQNDEYWFRLTLEQAEGRRVVRVATRAGQKDTAGGRVLATLPAPGDGPVRLRVTARGGTYDFHMAAGDGDWRPVLTGADGSILSTATAGGFLGVLIGPYAEGARP